MYFPNQCYIEITDKCNLRCKHCFAEAKIENEHFLSYEDIVQIYNEIKELGIVYVNISGGEPLLNPYFFEIIKFVAEQPYKTALLTNGLLWDEEKIIELSKVDPTKNILIQFSVDGQADIMNKQRNMTSFEYEKMLENIGLFKKYGFTVVGLHVADDITITESLKTVRFFLENHNMDSIQIVPAFMAGRALKNVDVLGNYWDKWSELVVRVTDIVKKNLWGTISKRLSLGFFTLYEIAVPLDEKGRHSDIWDVWGLNVDDIDVYQKQIHRKYYCEAGCSELAISAHKEFYPCVAAISSELGCGNLCKNSINEIWNSSEMLEKFRNINDKVSKKEPCLSCRYKEMCNGGCRVAAIGLTGDFYSPDPRCPIVMKYNQENKIL